MKHSSKSSPMLKVSRYHRWHEQFRPCLFSLVEHVDIANISHKNSVPKMHCEIEQSLWKKMEQFSALGLHLINRGDSSTIYFHNSPRYWIRTMNFIPYFWNERDGEKKSTQVKPLCLASELDAASVVAALNSSLFYWWYVILSDCRHLNLREINNFGIGIDQMDETIKQTLSELSIDLMQDLKLHSRRKDTNYATTGRVIYDEFHPSHSKHIIDKIDRVLAEHYGFTDEELDFIINYDIKYRMGLGN